MTLTTTESRTGQGATLNETSTAQVIQLLAHPTNVDVSDTLVALWAESTEQDAGDGYIQQARILAAILGRDVDRVAVRDALEAIGKIWALEHGNCVTELYGVPNTDHERDRWLRYEQEQLAIAARILGGGK
jgi:hypothetical protein